MMPFNPDSNIVDVIGSLQSSLDILASDQYKGVLRFPPGHYYSPLPESDEIVRKLSSRDDYLNLQSGYIDFQDDHQLAMLKMYAKHYKKAPFEDEPKEGLRFHHKNDYFGYSDAILLGHLEKSGFVLSRHEHKKAAQRRLGKNPCATF